MTHTDTTRSLFRAVWDRHEDDTARLVYADALDDAAGHETERAAFIRVQVELSRIGRKCETHNDDIFNRDGYCRSCRGRGRESKLLTAHGREWARVPWGEGGKGDAFDVREDTVQRDDARAAPHWHRGFVYRVDVPALSWVCERVAADPRQGLRSDGRGGFDYETPAPTWRVTPWALAVAAAHPVTEFVMGGLEPYTGGGMWRFDERELPAPVASRIPQVWYDSRESAFLALAVAAADVVRAAVREQWAKEGRP